MNNPHNLKRFASLVLLGVILSTTGCGDSGSGSGSGSAGGAGDAGGTATGRLSLQVTDAAVDAAEHVYVQFSEIVLQAAGGTRTTLHYCQDPMDATKTIVSDVDCTTPAATKQIDLLALSGGLTETLLDDFVLPAGHYVWLRLMVDTAGPLDSYIVVNGVPHELTIPSGAETGLKLNRGFDVPAGGSANFTIDFDLRKSVHVTGNGKYMMRPTLRLVDNSMMGTIAGTVATALVTPPNCTPAVYVFAGSGVTPDDIDGIDPDPVTTASVKFDSSDSQYKYTVAFLEPGDYTIAYTCDAALDDPTVDDALSFSGTTTVSVVAQGTTVHDF
jgi:hypothetical protein